MNVMYMCMYIDLGDPSTHAHAHTYTQSSPFPPPPPKKHQQDDDGAMEVVEAVEAVEAAKPKVKAEVADDATPRKPKPGVGAGAAATTPSSSSKPKLESVGGAVKKEGEGEGDTPGGGSGGGGKQPPGYRAWNAPRTGGWVWWGGGLWVWVYIECTTVCVVRLCRYISHLFILHIHTSNTHDDARHTHTHTSNFNANTRMTTHDARHTHPQYKGRSTWGACRCRRGGTTAWTG